MTIFEGFLFSMRYFQQHFRKAVHPILHANTLDTYFVPTQALAKQQVNEIFNVIHTYIVKYASRCYVIVALSL